MLEITRVDVVDSQTLDIELNNGHLILFDTRRLTETGRGYDALRDMEVLPRPETDGQSVFWHDGTRLALTEIFSLLTKQENNQK